MAGEIQERFDFGRLSGKLVEDIPGGGKRIPSRPARVGVQVYRRADGSIRREYRPPEEVFAPESLSSYRDAPVVHQHPAMIRSDNRTTLAQGHVSGEARPDGAFVAASLAVTGADLLSRIDRGEVCELSCGYTCRTDETPGEIDGEKYDAIQREIRINHVGLGPAGWARGGSALAIRTDGWYSETDGTPDQTDRGTMIRFDGRDFATEDDLRKYVADLAATQAAGLVTKQIGDLSARVDRADAALVVVTKERDEARVALETERKDREDSIAKRVSERTDLVSKATAILPTVKIDGCSDRQIREQIVQATYPEAKLDGRSDDYVAALFDQAVSSGKRADGIDSVAKKITEVKTERNDGTPAKKCPTSEPEFYRSK